MADPWDRQEGEPTLWFGRFERYRKMGNSRTMLGCVRAEEADKGRVEQSQKVPGAWNEACQTWRWRDRAEAWDALQVALARKEEAEVLAQRRKAWIAQAQAIQGKGVQRLLTLDPDDLSFRDVLAAVTEGVKLELLARGEAQSITRSQHEGAISITSIEAIEPQPVPPTESEGEPGDGAEED